MVKSFPIVSGNHFFTTIGITNIIPDAIITYIKGRGKKRDNNAEITRPTVKPKA